MHPAYEILNTLRWYSRW